MFPMPLITPNAGVSSMTLHGTTTGAGGTVTIPAGVQSGDIIMVGHGDRSSAPTIGTGFTLIAKAGNTNSIYTDSGISLAYKISDGTETSVSGWTGVDGRWCCAVFRPNTPIRFDNMAQGVAYASRNGTPSVTIDADASSMVTVSMAAMWDGSNPHAANYGTFSADGNDPITGATELQYDTGSYGITCYFKAQTPDSAFDILADSPRTNVHSFGAGYVEVK